MKLLYITSMLPFGTTEAFFLPELAELKRRGHEVVVLPTWPRGSRLHVAPGTLDAVSAPLLSRLIVRSALACAVTRPLATFRALRSLLQSRSAKILLKNLAVVPKALWAARLARSMKVDHIHAQWAATSATVGMIASAVSGIPWSFTAHRWDIPEDNLLEAKLGSAQGVRAISERGATVLRQRAGARRDRVIVGRLGVDVPLAPVPIAHDPRPLRIVTVANLIEVKGHRYLLEALALARRDGVDVSAEFIGQGPVEEALRGRAGALGIAAHVRFTGVLPHSALLARLLDGSWDAMVLPSICTETGVEEGVPVALMEAMAAGLPVVSTATGAIAELAGGGAGLLVPDKDSPALARVLALLVDPVVRARLAASGRRRILAEYDVSSAVARLLGLIDPITALDRRARSGKAQHGGGKLVPTELRAR